MSFLKISNLLLKSCFPFAENNVAYHSKSRSLRWTLSPFCPNDYILYYSMIFRHGYKWNTFDLETSSFRFRDDVKRLINLSLFQQNSSNINWKFNWIWIIWLKLNFRSAAIFRFHGGLATSMSSKPIQGNWIFKLTRFWKS